VDLRMQARCLVPNMKLREDNFSRRQVPASAPLRRSAAKHRSTYGLHLPSGHDIDMFCGDSLLQSVRSEGLTEM
jgi:hypothetical protein